jgi:3-hydroxyacyl-CoA dehydrogenase
MSRAAPEAVRRVAVLGAGTIGASWTAQFLARGLTVAAYDPAPDVATRLRAQVEQAWPALARLGLAPDADPERIEIASSPAAAVAGADFVQESGPENLAAKQALLAACEAALAPDAIVASCTSGFMPSALQAGRLGPERYVVGHPFNPPHLIPLVEVVGGQATDPAAVDWTVAFYRRLGKRPIKLQREVPGHVANRMQVALYREAMDLVLRGVASMADVDAAIAYGPGLRWAIMGPHLQHQLAGGAGGMRHHLEHIGPAMAGWWADLRQPALTEEAIDRLVAAFEATAPAPMAALVAERDALLVALLETLAATRAQLAAPDEASAAVPGADAPGAEPDRAAQGAAPSARQTFSGVIGMSIVVTPWGARASSTALTIAAGAPVAPASPAPLTPIGLCGQGTSLAASSKAGRSSARGKA